MQRVQLIELLVFIAIVGVGLLAYPDLSVYLVIPAASLTSVIVAAVLQPRRDREEPDELPEVRSPQAR